MKQALILIALLALTALAQNVAGAKVCAKAAGNANASVPGGWTRMTKAEIISNENLQADAKKQADALAANQNADCKVKKVQILKACDQVVAGMNYEYVARVKMACGKKTTTKMVVNKFYVPLG